jgi:A/G-specific adenine glycosylase
MEKISFINSRLKEWYKLNHRELPWRNTTDPYKIWISEIILQQTRVAQGLNYYNNFIHRFPNLRSLAEAPEQEVLKQWQGLGYYSRARNLHAAAQTIVNHHGGEFPRNHADILRLKGIGHYTAAAIASFAWNQPYPAVDGNVFRFLSRLFAIDQPVDSEQGKKHFTQLAAKLMDPSQAGAFNQAIMEFGALQCTPSAPDCHTCPFQDECLAHASRTMANYPVKRNKTQTVDRYLYYFHIHDAEYLYIKQRREKGIWQNLFEFPVVESDRPLTFHEITGTPPFKEWFPTPPPGHFHARLENRKHVLSHRILYASFYELPTSPLPCPPAGLLRIAREEISNYPVHRLMQLYLNSL